MITVGYGMGRYAAEKEYPTPSLPSSMSTFSAVETKLDALYTQVMANKQQIDLIAEKNGVAIKNLNQKISLKNNTQAAIVAAKEESPEPTQEEKEAGAREFEAFIQREKEAYDAEVVDFTWAPSAESDLDAGLSEMEADMQFELINSECRSSRCSATVSFDNYEAATEYGNQLAEQALPGLNCAQSISLPPPGDLSAKYQANLMLDCSQQVQGLVQSNY